MRVVALVLGTLLTLGYPFVLYLTLSRWGARRVGLAVLLLALPRIAWQLRRGPREHLSHVLRVPAAVALLGGLAALVGDPRFLLAMPTLVNLTLLVTFGASLRGEMPLVERFARMQVSELSEAERRWCRQVTVAWCVFFAANALTAALLAAAAPIAWWTLFTGVLSYVAVGVMFAVEYVVRSYRFRHYTDALPDRLMAVLLPPRAREEAS